jgi:hypothetical protein
MAAKRLQLGDNKEDEMGRPKGSKNKKKAKVKKKQVKQKVVKIVKTEKGVTAKNAKNAKNAKTAKKKQAYSKYSNLPDDYVEPKTLKFAGHCPTCDMSLTTKDFVTKTIFECIGCGCRKNKKHLLKESKAQKERARVTKKQYLKETAKLSKIKGNTHISDLPDVSIMNDIKE